MHAAAPHDAPQAHPHVRVQAVDGLAAAHVDNRRLVEPLLYGENCCASKRASRRPMGSFCAHHGVAFPMYEEKLRKPTLVTWRRYSTAQAGSAMSQMNAK